MCVVGSGTRFLSGISYYTHRLALALAGRNDVSVILMRRLLPARLYPGWRRVGQPLAALRYPPGVRTFDGVDWYWLPSAARAVSFLRRAAPEVVVLEWWTGAVLHSFLLLALAARRMGARVVVEFHEVQDPGETRVPLAAAYVDLLLPRLLRLADGAVVHSEWDREALGGRYDLGRLPVALVPHGPYDGYGPPGREGGEPGDDGVCRLLYFGVIRPFKGVEDLVRAFDSIPEDEIGRYHLTVVGETWEGWRLPGQLIAASPHRDRITFINRYVADDEVAELLARADAIVLPYHRSSASGPLHLAMGQGLPVVVSRVGGLVEAARDYGGTVFVPPRDPGSIRAALAQVAQMKGRRFPDPHSWQQTADGFAALFEEVLGDSPVPARVSSGGDR
ncbi:MAG: glycosyltransferase family 4 protein [Acidimicrobiales bacterium]